MEWLWNPQIVGIYNRLLQRCELNKHTTEAASGALQNITAGDRRVRTHEGNVPWACPVSLGCSCWSLGGCGHHAPHQPGHLATLGKERRRRNGVGGGGCLVVLTGVSTFFFCPRSGRAC